MSAGLLPERWRGLPQPWPRRVEAPMNEDIERDRVVDFWTGLQDGELVGILERVFSGKQPDPEESAYRRSRFFHATAASSLESAEEELKRWGLWEIHAVAYVDRDEY